MASQAAINQTASKSDTAPHETPPTRCAFTASRAVANHLQPGFSPPNLSPRPLPSTLSSISPFGIVYLTHRSMSTN
jgi:hypothetical protein